MSYALPSVCADQVAAGSADIGILPVIETARQGLDYFRGTGIACHGPVRTILLVSKLPMGKIETLATDSGSRTSVMLSQVILSEQYNVRPRVFSRPADLASMLEVADAALIIGDAAFAIDPATVPFECLDLGAEWVRMTGLPMVFAVWSARKEWMQPRLERAFADSCRFGLEHMDDIVRAEAPGRGLSEAVVQRYLTEHLVLELGDRDYQGMNLYLKMALSLDKTTVAVSAGREQSS
jgi:predicted solute-binding protein